MFATPALLGPALGTYLLAPPILHYRHGRTGRAVASLILRAGLPVGFGYLAARGGGDDDEVAAGLGVLAGLALAMVIDDAFLAGADEPHAPVSVREHALVSPTIARARDGGVTFGLAGLF